ncbi:LINE-1 retrotransposable element ORF2 protein [Camelus dromedarius]|uniref:LINE-1 retrotransposable element ORF2 protein n=1 Tax=Camelus dromedarius TaxID=9838 RepID=A0A5N4C0I9_CAMDR|nr:LINE-1 retrotransposable element ORF2 protein [Camelus dromedarius]
MFIAALVTIAKSWKQPKCPLTVDRIKKMWYTYTMEYYSAIKKSKTMPFAATWMDLEMVILSELTLLPRSPISQATFGTSLSAQSVHSLVRTTKVQMNRRILWNHRLLPSKLRVHETQKRVERPVVQGSGKPRHRHQGTRPDLRSTPSGRGLLDLNPGCNFNDTGNHSEGFCKAAPEELSSEIQDDLQGNTAPGGTHMMTLGQERQRNAKVGFHHAVLSSPPAALSLVTIKGFPRAGKLTSPAKNYHLESNRRRSIAKHHGLTWSEYVRGWVCRSTAKHSDTLGVNVHKKSRVRPKERMMIKCISVGLEEAALKRLFTACPDELDNVPRWRDRPRFTQPQLQCPTFSLKCVSFPALSSCVSDGVDALEAGRDVPMRGRPPAGLRPRTRKRQELPSDLAATISTQFPRTSPLRSSNRNIEASHLRIGHYLELRPSMWNTRMNTLVSHVGVGTEKRQQEKRCRGRVSRPRVRDPDSHPGALEWEPRRSVRMTDTQAPPSWGGLTLPRSFPPRSGKSPWTSLPTHLWGKLPSAQRGFSSGQMYAHHTEAKSGGGTLVKSPSDALHPDRVMAGTNRLDGGLPNPTVSPLLSLPGLHAPCLRQRMKRGSVRPKLQRVSEQMPNPRNPKQSRLSLLTHHLYNLPSAWVPLEGRVPIPASNMGTPQADGVKEGLKQPCGKQSPFSWKRAGFADVGKDLEAGQNTGEKQEQDYGERKLGVNTRILGPWRNLERPVMMSRALESPAECTELLHLRVPPGNQKGPPLNVPSGLPGGWTKDRTARTFGDFVRWVSESWGRTEKQPCPGRSPDQGSLNRGANEAQLLLLIKPPRCLQRAGKSAAPSFPSQPPPRIPRGPSSSASLLFSPFFSWKRRLPPHHVLCHL